MKATIETRRGTIEVELYEADAPKTVANFAKLAGEGFYDDLEWHRIEKDFVCQTGCPEGTGTGGPGYTIEDEPNAHRHLTGTLSMANTGEPNSGGSQFFLCHRPLPELDGKHTVFGRLTKGLDVLYKLKKGDSLDAISVTAD